VTQTTNARTVDLQIDDEGPGVEPSKIAHMFERYFSSRSRDGDAADAQHSEHAGLGLWIVQRNVEALGGQVGAGNRIGGGLSVTITLPRNDS
jgi:two-component system sensor histidine kinase ChvG